MGTCESLVDQQEHGEDRLLVAVPWLYRSPYGRCGGKRGCVSSPWFAAGINGQKAEVITLYPKR